MTDKLGPYILGPNDDENCGIYTGDARVLAEAIPDESVDLVFTDPPFGTGTYTTDIEPDKDTWQQIRRIGKNLFAIMGYPELLFRWAKYFSDLKLIEYIIWHKYNAPLAGHGLTRVHQDIAIWGISKGQIDSKAVREPYSKDDHLAKFHNLGVSARYGGKRHTLRHPEGRRCSDLWEIASPGAGFNSHLRRHVNEKPEELAKRVILILSKPNDIVLDPFTGSGTFPAVAKQLGRRYLAFEIDPETAELARERVRKTQPPLFVMDSHEQTELSLSLRNEN